MKSGDMFHGLLQDLMLLLFRVAVSVIVWDRPLRYAALFSLEHVQVVLIRHPHNSR